MTDDLNKLKDFWNLEISEMFQITDLLPIENDILAREEIKQQKNKIQQILNNVRPDTYTFGMNAETIEKISQKYNDIKYDDGLDTEYTKEALESAEFAQQVLSQAMKGRHIDLSFFKKFAEKKTQSINQLENKNRRVSVKLKLPTKKDLLKKKI